jgi:dTDP-glucose 4,6-dehydratase
MICQLTDKRLGNKPGTSEQLITFITDRPGHDARYAIDSTKIRTQLGWAPSSTFEELLDQTISWYLENDQWLADVTSGIYMDYYNQQYKGR